MSKRMQKLQNQEVSVISQNILIAVQDETIERQEEKIEEQKLKIVMRNPFRAPLCEFCGGEGKVYCVRPPFRYCKCQRCGWTFKK